ncbi:MAG TPA: heavy metal-binding domain-containing protein [Acidimicrobiales bacterium]|nr:heavy metal-binding domain-containing protein [Acidimicrobiales bacterium]
MPTSESATPNLPKEAIERLRQLEGAEGKPPLFTSDLSVNEFLLLEDTDFEPLGLVVGSSIYHVGIQVVRWTASRELEVLTRAMYHARELAMARMEAEAEMLGADGIVGVRLEIQFYEWGKNLAEFMAIGTAVRHRKGGNWKAPSGKPFTSDLSGQDFWTLLQTGKRPVAMVMGNCVYHVAHRRALVALSQTFRNVELPNFTQALYSARELAMERMQYEALHAEATGVIGVQITEKNHIWGHHAIEFFAIGTAVVAYRDGGPSLRPRLTLGLDS